MIILMATVKARPETADHVAAALQQVAVNRPEGTRL
jgi:hypothetical protein